MARGIDHAGGCQAALSRISERGRRVRSTAAVRALGRAHVHCARSRRQSHFVRWTRRVTAVFRLRTERAMSKVVAIMSMSLDGYVADPNDGVAEVFDWYFHSGDVEFHTGGSDPMTFKGSAPSADHLRGPPPGLGAVHPG